MMSKYPGKQYQICPDLKNKQTMRIIFAVEVMAGILD